MNEAIKVLLERLDDNGFASCKVADGHVIAISKNKLIELLKQVTDSNREAAIVFLKDPSKLS